MYRMLLSSLFFQKMLQKLKDNHGFSLIEVIIMMFFVSGLFMVILATFSGIVALSRQTNIKMSAISSIEEAIEILRDWDYDDITPGRLQQEGLDSTIVTLSKSEEGKAFIYGTRTVSITDHASKQEKLITVILTWKEKGKAKTLKIVTTIAK